MFAYGFLHQIGIGNASQFQLDTYVRDAFIVVIQLEPRIRTNKEAIFEIVDYSVAGAFLHFCMQ